ncbi:MAG: DUF302 domain-containing protein [Candidatus Promineifilaceae bacterium]|nr:DUF302 domain-containing protein [Candidatus Promineifilaceae bacterium]
MTAPIERTGYTYRKQLDLPYEEAVKRVTEALKEEGFGVLTEIDVRATLYEKLGVEDFPHYVILGACNPPLAHRALQQERDIGALLPCNVIVYDDEAGGSIVAAVDPWQMMSVVQNSSLEPIGDEAAARLQRALDAV